jgi:hypothetical protein
LLHHSESMLVWNVTHIGVIHSVRFMNSVYVIDQPERFSLILSPPLSKWSWKLWILYLILNFFRKVPFKQFDWNILRDYGQAD